jgi:ribonuclease Z
MEVIFLGTSAGIPTRRRNVSCIVVRYEGDYIFVDVGEGTQRQAAIAGIGLRKNMRIFITHMHGDHVLGLIPMLQSMCMLGRSEPLEVYGPRGIRGFISSNLRSLDIKLTFPLKIRYLSDGACFDFGRYVVRAVRGEHGRYSYALAVEEKPRPGSLDIERVVRDGIPRNYWRMLKAGRDIVLGGRVYRASDYLTPPYRGRKVVISSDTRPSERIIRFARGADVLIHEATFSEDKLERSIETLHSTAREAAEVARRAGVKILILTHFSARYEDVAGLVEEAREVFPATFAAEDFLRFEIPPSRRHL